MPRACLPILVFFFARCFAYQAPAAPAANHLEDPFALGWMLVDTNGDGIADSINGNICVTGDSAAHNAAAANLAARLAYGTTGFTPPLVNGPQCGSETQDIIVAGHPIMACRRTSMKRRRALSSTLWEALF